MGQIEAPKSQDGKNTEERSEWEYMVQIEIEVLRSFISFIHIITLLIIKYFPSSFHFQGGDGGCELLLVMPLTALA